MTRKRICMVGAGRVGRVHTANLRSRVGNRADVVAICDPDLRAAEKLAGDFGVQATFPTLREALQADAFDGAVLTTPTFTHRDQAVVALESGVSLHLEKPMAMNLPECHDITAAAARSGAAVQLGFMRRFDQDFIDADAALRRAEIGTPMIIKSLTHGPGLPPAWANDIRTSNGMLAEVASHDLDTVTWFADDEPIDIVVRVANFKGAERGVATPHFYDTLAATITFRSGTIAVVTAVCPADYGYDSRVEIIGTRGLLQIGATGPGGLTTVTAGGGHARSPVFPSWRDRFAEAYAREMVEFIDALDGAPVRVGTAAGTQAVALVLAGTVSLLENRTVPVSEALTMTVPPWQANMGKRT